MKSETKTKISKFYDKQYKLILFVPVVLVLICLIYLGSFYAQHGDIMYKDVSLAGGTSITLTTSTDTTQLEENLQKQFSDVSFRKLTDFKTGKQLALIIESSADSKDLIKNIESSGFVFTSENSSVEVTGPSLSNSFYKQLMIALVISFFLMSCVIFILFRTFIPSIAVIFAAFSDIVMPLALLDFLGIKISAAGIAAFLMLIGYSVDTDILLTTRAVKNQGESTLNKRIYGAYKTGIFMTTTALLAVLPAFFISGLPESFRQIFLILALGLFADIFNTWISNASIIKWYCVKHNIK